MDHTSKQVIVPIELLEKMLAVTKDYFALPMSVKEAMDNLNSPAFRGYIRLGSENTAGEG